MCVMQATAIRVRSNCKEVLSSDLVLFSGLSQMTKAELYLLTQSMCVSVCESMCVCQQISAVFSAKREINDSVLFNLISCGTQVFVLWMPSSTQRHLNTIHMFTIGFTHTHTYYKYSTHTYTH